MTLLSTTEQAVELAEIAADARDYVAASRAENTSRSYRTGWAQFTAWCTEHRVTSLPSSAETVACYVADLAKTAKPATIDARLAAISAAHRAAGYESSTKAETARLVRRGVRRTLGTAQRQVHPVTVAELRTMVEGLGTDPGGCRDRALLLLGFAGALRRSELVGLDTVDVNEGTDGLTLRLRRSKTDQEGAGRSVGIPYGSNPATCPVRAWRAWLELSGITAGPAFRPVDRHGRIGATCLTAQAVALVLKRHAARIGLDPGEVAGHSLRAGLATSAAAAGVPERVIAEQTGHRGTAMLRRYIREGSLFRENAASARSHTSSRLMVFVGPWLRPQRFLGSLPAGDPQRTVEIDTEVGRVEAEAVSRGLSVDPSRAGRVELGKRDPAAAVLDFQHRFAAFVVGREVGAVPILEALLLDHEVEVRLQHRGLILEVLLSNGHPERVDLVRQPLRVLVALCDRDVEAAGVL